MPSVKELAKITLGIEDSTNDAPDHYVQSLARFLTSNPMDIHFIMELGREGQSVGGNGFGSVTCMEDYCWEDIILDADPTMDIGLQRKNGLGSFWNFKTHCEVEKHVKGRNERCVNEGITITETKNPFESASNASSARTVQSVPAPAPAWTPAGQPRSAQEQDDLLSRLKAMEEKSRKVDEVASRPRHQSQIPWLQAHENVGPSKVASGSTWQLDDRQLSSRSKYSSMDHSSSPSRPSDRLTSTSNALQPIDPNAWSSRSRSGDQSLKPFGSSTFGSSAMKGKAATQIDDDDDDDDIIELTNDAVPPGMRKSNRAPPIMVSDEDAKPNFGSQRGSSQSSYMSGPSRSQMMTGMPASSQSNSQTNSQAAPALSKRDVRTRYGYEIDYLKAAHKTYSTGASKNDYKRRVIINRYNQVEVQRTLVNTATGWIAPSEEVMSLVPGIRALVASFGEIKTAYPSSVLERKPFPREYYRDIAGPSSQPLIPPAPRKPNLPQHVPTARMAPIPNQYQSMPGAFPGMMDVKPPPSQIATTMGALARQYLTDPAAAAMDLGASMRAAMGIGGPAVGLGPGGMGMSAVPNLDDLMNPFAEPNRPDNLQEFFSNSLNSFEEDQDVEGALKYLDLRDLQQRFRDLSVTLMPHQVLGVKFMIEQEKKRRMKGGLLADAMGLGKTLSSIAVIAGHPSEDRKVKTTLVVAPLALLQQWKSEIESKTTSGRKVLIHWGPKRTNSPAQLKQYDVVLTTYGILTAEHGQQKRKGKAKQNESDESDDGGLSLTDPIKQGPIFKVLWYRVILDEAHMIRNQSTRAARASFDLNSIYRWCLTGTPVMNTLGDLYPILHFLNISPQADLKAFRGHITKVEKKRPRLAADRMQAILKTCSIRRNKDSTLNGVRLLNLPPKIITWDELELTPDERHIYTSIENRMQVKFNALLKRGTVLKHYSMVLVMLVRLKQATSHPFLLTRRAEDAAHPEDVVISDEELMGTRDAALLDDMKELQRALDHMGQEYVDKVAQMLEDRWKEVQKYPEGGPDSEQTGTECAICFEPYEHEHAERITECCHSYCATCMEELWNDAPRTTDLTDTQLEKNMRQCPLCREPISREKVFRASAFFNPEEQADIKPQVDGEGSVSVVKSNGKRASEGPDDDEVKPALKKLIMSKGKGRASDFTQAVEDKPKPEPVNYEELDITPSTKMRHLLAVIQEKLQDPSVKVVAYSQFTSFLDLCFYYLRANGVSALMYQGSMAAGERQETLNSFNTPPDLEGGQHRVLLLSLKAGGVGLNLTVSNTVIALDLAWNAATEDQAVDRCHRIGQVREVDVRRLCVKNSIDERIRDLQENKRKLADGALGEGEGGKMGRLSIGDLIRLFNVDGGGHDA